MRLQMMIQQLLREIDELFVEIPFRNLHDPLYHYLEGKREVAEWVLQQLKEGS